MRIKFLSFIASFFMVSFVITSCLDDDNNIEYSPDATIHAFELDTVGYGKTYKFTIDQLKGEIYNEDSLPVHADTIIDRILIKTLTTSSQYVTILKEKPNGDGMYEDSVYLNISDSIDLRKPLSLRVYSTEALAYGNREKSKKYTISVRVHKHDPDSLRWNRVGDMNNSIIKEQKTIEFNDSYLTYSVDASGALKVYQNNLLDWSASGENTTGDLTNALPNSILSLDNIILATANNEVYESTDGKAWTKSSKLSGEINTLIASLPVGNDTKITYIKTENGVRYIYSIFKSKLETADSEVKIEAAGKNFPVDNISYTTIDKNNYYRNIIVGKHEPVIELEVNKVKTSLTVAWGYDGTTWTELGTSTSTTAYCPAFDSPTVIYYNNLLYVFGDKFESIYVSKNEGIAWEKANKKFSFPYQDWSESSFVPSNEKPEFRGRVNYSVVQDTDNKYIYFLFSKGAAAITVGENQTYSHDPEVWRARLNQLWFDLAKGK